MLNEAVCQVYLAKHRLTNLFSKVLTASPSSAHLEVMETALSALELSGALPRQRRACTTPRILKSEMSAD
jgi:hypothetical protein